MTSANAPAGMATRNPGTAHAVCTRLTPVGESDRSVIAHAAPTVCMVVPMFDTSAASHRLRNTVTRSGDHGLVGAGSVAVTPAFCRAIVPGK